MGRTKTRVYLCYSVGSRPVGRVVFELYYDLTPKTAGFFQLCCTAKPQPHLYGKAINKVVEGALIKGDLPHIPASPLSDYPKDESFTRRHAHAGVLSICNNQFIVTLSEQSHLDGASVVVGQVVDGMDCIFQLAKVPTDANERPRIPVHITDCGTLNELEQDLDSEIEELATDGFPSVDEQQEAEGVVSKRRADLRARMNQAIKLNNKAVIEEQLRLNDPTYERRKDQSTRYAEMQRGLDDNVKPHLLVTANAYQKGSKKREQKPKETFGWDVFNQDSLYRAYEKRVAKIPKLGEGTQTERVDVMAREVEDHIAKRALFSRRRTFNDEKDVTSINERNRRFNDKLERNYAKYSNEIRGNLERGTAM